MNPTALDKSTSVYDYDLHMPIPTLSFIAAETGEDMIINIGNEAKAMALVRKYTKIAYNLLMSTKIQQTRNDMEFLIATNPEYRLAFISFVAGLISDMYVAGDEAMLLADGVNIAEHLTLSTRALLEGGLLSISRFTFMRYNYREGY